MRARRTAPGGAWWSGRGAASPGEDEADVVAAEAERVGQGGGPLTGARFAAYHVEFHARGPSSSRLRVAGSAPSLSANSANSAAMAPTAPDAPIMCPVIDFVAVTAAWSPTRRRTVPVRPAEPPRPARPPAR
ncbi:hypothetical protein GCM10023324_06100 [Streptomyces youssoufiensis]